MMTQRDLDRVAALMAAAIRNTVLRELEKIEREYAVKTTLTDVASYKHGVYYAGFDIQLTGHTGHENLKVRITSET